MFSTKPVAIVIVGMVFISLLTFAFALPTPLLAPRIRSGPSTSTNWSGYAVTGAAGSVSDVKASWVVPAIQGTCPSTNQYASFWVGIDGYSSNTVEQIGTDSDCQGGRAVYYAWYEFYPKASFTISSITITTGDKISAEVKYAGGKFTATITDTTTRKTFSTSAKVNNAKRSSAEWIAEAPYSGGILPLANFGTVYFGSDSTGVTSTCYATVNGVTGPIGSFGSSVQEITMVSQSSSTTIKAQPSSSLSSDKTSFTITWYNAGP
jgi:hypothetical protein